MKHQYSKNIKSQNFYNIIDNIEVYDEDLRTILESQIYSENPIKYIYTEEELKRKMVNSIRHNYSNYEKNLKNAKKNKRTNNTELNYIQYKNCILERISLKYPNFKDECDRQKSKLDMCKIIK